jgi:hypothetical protein
VNSLQSRRSHCDIDLDRTVGRDSTVLSKNVAVDCRSGSAADRLGGQEPRLPPSWRRRGWTDFTVMSSCYTSLSAPAGVLQDHLDPAWGWRPTRTVEGQMGGSEGQHRGAVAVSTLRVAHRLPRAGQDSNFALGKPLEAAACCHALSPTKSTAWTK